MTLRKSIIALLKDEGFAINEAIEDALDEFIAFVEDENEGGLAEAIEEVEPEVDEE